MRATIASLAFGAELVFLMEAGRVLLPWEPGVQIQIQLKHVDSRLSEQAELARLCVLLDEKLYLIFRNSTLQRDSQDLKLSRCWRNIRIESGSGCCYQVNRNGPAGIVRLGADYICLHPVNQVLIGRAKLGAIGICGVVSVSRRRRTGVEIAGTDE